MIYFIRRLSDSAIRIGTTNNIHDRLRQHRENHGDIDLLGIMDGSYDVETDLLKRFHHLRLFGKQDWFLDDFALLEFVGKNTSLELPPVPEPKVHIQLTDGLVEVLNILKSRYGAATQAEALALFIGEHDPDTLKAGETIADTKFVLSGVERPKRKPKK